ncbi:MAG: DUF115 domain-containing protein [Magnetococcus sp. DMHC-6]
MSEQQDTFGSFLVNQFGESYLPAINGEVFSQMGSDNLFQSHYNDLLEKKDALYILVGTDSGLLLHYILKQKKQEGTRYLFIEIPQVIHKIRQPPYPTTLPPHVAVCTLESWLKQAEDFSIKDYFYLNTIQIIKSLAVMDAFHPEYVHLWNQFQEQYVKIIFNFNMEIGSQTFMIKGLENLAENRHSSALLNALFQGRSAVLLAGGPSLDDSLPWVRAHREKLVVLAVSRIAPQLIQHKITPDFIFTIDPHSMIFHQSKEMLHFWPHALLINMYHANPQLLSQWQGRSLFMGILFPWDTPLNEENHLFNGITVSHQALGMAVVMGFKQVILGGFDLCFSQSGFTHNKGSVEREIGPFAESTEIRVETNGGWLAETRFDFASAIPSMEALATFALKNNCQVLNPAPGAAKIASIKHIPFEEIDLGPTPETSAMDILKEKLPIETSQTRCDHYQKVLKELDRMRKEFVQVRNLTIEAINCNAALFGRKGKLPNFKFKHRMDAIEQELDQEYIVASRLVKKWGIRELLRLSRPDKNRDLTFDETEENTNRYYVNYRNSATDLIHLLDDMKERIRCRLEEEKPKINFQTLLAQWKKDDVPGRLKVCLYYRGETMADIPPPWKERCQELEQLSLEKMNATENTYTEFCIQDQAQPQMIRVKIVTLFRNRDASKLETFMIGLQDSTIAEKTSFIHLAGGYLAELNGDLDTAIRHYRQITYEFLRADALRHTLSILLRQKDLRAALAVSKRLCSLSALHIPNYADLLRLTGQKEEAIVFYGDYLKIVRKDYMTQFKMAKLYAEMGEQEKALQIFRQILTEDPDNKAARLYIDQLQPTT